MSSQRNSLRLLAISLSLANLAFIPNWLELLFRDAASGYYMQRLPAGVDFFAAVFAVLGIGAVFFGVAWLGERAKFFRVVWGVLFVLALAVPLNALRLKLPREVGVGRILSLGPVWLAAFAVIAAAIAYLMFRARSKLVPGVSGAVAILAPFAALTILRASWAGATREEEPRMIAKPPATATATTTSTTVGSVVWMIFDELDYRLAFEQRPADLELPEFDRLRAESLFATHALPPSDATLKSIPSLITGRVVREAAVEGPDDLLLTYEGETTAVPWSQQPNVFAAARALGAGTGIVGWYHPYCRILARDLTSCAWSSVYQTAIGRMEAPTFFESALAQTAAVLPTNGRRLHIESYEEILANAKRALEKHERGLLYIHLSVPHPPSIYDRDSKTTTVRSWSNVTGYIGNLALADRALGELRPLIDADTALIVSADHPWRQSKAYDQKKDARVPFLVKLPGQKISVDHTQQVMTVRTSSLIQQLLRRALQTPEDLQSWLNKESPTR